MFVEFDLVIEREDHTLKANSQPPETTASIDTLMSDTFTEEELNKAVEPQKQDKSFLKFKEALSVEPEQVNFGNARVHCNII